MPDDTPVQEGSKSEKAPGEKVICLYPGCENEAVDPPRKNETTTSRARVRPRATARTRRTTRPPRTTR